MSAEIERHVQAGFEAFRAGEIERLFSDAAEDIVISQPREIPGARPSHGLRGLVGASGDGPSQWDEFDVELIDTEVIGDGCALSWTRQRLRARDLKLDVD